MNKTKQAAISISTMIPILLTSTPTKSHPALTGLAPLCGGPQLVVCAVVGVVVIGGVTFKVIHNEENNDNYLLPTKGKKKVINYDTLIRGNGKDKYTIIEVSSAKKAFEECDKIKPAGTLVRVTKLRKGRYQCDFVDVSQEIDIDKLLE